jgi:predicted flap endonuclease-1-like 5' DNA nuclease
MNIERIEGIGPEFAGKLRRAGIRTANGLLKAGAQRADREALARRTGISGTLLLEWVNLADLMRIKGVGEEYSDLLEEVGVDSVRELRNRRPDNLYQALLDARARRLVRRMPGRSQVKDWVDQAKRLPPVVTH